MALPRQQSPSHALSSGHEYFIVLWVLLVASILFIYIRPLYVFLASSYYIDQARSNSNQSPGLCLPSNRIMDMRNHSQDRVVLWRPQGPLQSKSSHVHILNVGITEKATMMVWHVIFFFFLSCYHPMTYTVIYPTLCEKNRLYSLVYSQPGKLYQTA